MSKALRAGAAKVNITPDASFFPVFNKMNGSGGAPSIFRCAHDDIFVRAFVFENDDNRVLVLSFEWGMLDSLYGDERIFTRIAAEAAGIPVENVLNTCTHNHNCFDINFAKMLKDKIDVKANLINFFQNMVLNPLKKQMSFASQKV